VDAFGQSSKALGSSRTWVLTHFHADHYMGLGKGFKQGRILCTPTTAALVRLKLRVPEQLLVPVPLGQEITVEGERGSQGTGQHSDKRPLLLHAYDLVDGPILACHDYMASCGCSEAPGPMICASWLTQKTMLHLLLLLPVFAGTRLQFVDANHCPGAAMVVAHPPGGLPPVLHTGDARLTREATQQQPALQALVRRAVLVLDTTYADPSYCFPPQQEVLQWVLRAVQVRACGQLSNILPCWHKHMAAAAMHGRYLFASAVGLCQSSMPPPSPFPEFLHRPLAFPYTACCCSAGGVVQPPLPVPVWQLHHRQGAPLPARGAGAAQQGVRGRGQARHHGLPGPAPGAGRAADHKPPGSKHTRGEPSNHNCELREYPAV
jgi:hypothetical protein